MGGEGGAYRPTSCCSSGCCCCSYYSYNNPALARILQRVRPNANSERGLARGGYVYVILLLVEKNYMPTAEGWGQLARAPAANTLSFMMSRESWELPIASLRSISGAFSASFPSQLELELECNCKGLHEIETCRMREREGEAE